jgi:ATP-binding cassette, subfamily B, multidrug efflux pump
VLRQNSDLPWFQQLPQQRTGRETAIKIVMLQLLLGWFRRSLRSRRDLLLENLALRQQRLVLKRRHTRPRLNQYLQVVMTESLGQRAIHELRQEVFSNLQKVPIQIYDRNPIGRLMTHLTADVDALNEMLKSGTIGVLSNVIVVLYTVFWMFRINWSLALMFCAILLAMVLFTFWFRKMAKPLIRSLREQIAAINTFLEEHLTGMQIVQILTRESREKEKFRGINQEYWRAGMATIVRDAIFYSVIEAMALTGIALIIWVGGG